MVAPIHKRRAVLRLVAKPIATAFAIRLMIIPFLYTDRLDPWHGHWRFAWEMGMVARSLATGKGFASPFPPSTGPTAWFPPVYPAVMAAVFNIFGVFTAASAIALLALNSVCSALTCVPIFLIARKTIGERQARWAAWMWAFFPYAIYLSAARIWENALSTLLLASLVWYTLVLVERGNTRLWAGYGAAWAAMALTNPATCALLPPLGLWVAWRRSREGRPWLRDATLGALVFALLITPWEIRNAVTFHQPVPLRDNFWMEMRVGNTGDITDIYQDWAHPGRSQRELQLFQAMGETAYLAHIRAVTVDFMSQYPGTFLSLTARRFLYTWIGFWSTNPIYEKREPFAFPNMFFSTSLTLLMLLGVRWVWRNKHRWAMVYILPIACFPLVYYLTHPGIEYRHPIDPLVVILASTAVAGFFERRTMTSAGGNELNRCGASTRLPANER